MPWKIRKIPTELETTTSGLTRNNMSLGNSSLLFVITIRREILMIIQVREHGGRRMAHKMPGALRTTATKVCTGVSLCAAAGTQLKHAMHIMGRGSDSRSTTTGTMSMRIGELLRLTRRGVKHTIRVQIGVLLRMKIMTGALRTLKAERDVMMNGGLRTTKGPTRIVTDELHIMVTAEPLTMRRALHTMIAGLHIMADSPRTRRGAQLLMRKAERNLHTVRRDVQPMMIGFPHMTNVGSHIIVRRAEHMVRAERPTTAGDL